MGAYPALAIQPPQIQDPLQEYQRVAQIKGQIQQQELQQQDIAIKKQQAQDLQATTAAMQEADPKSPTYFDDLPKLVLKHGGSANAATAMQQHGMTVQKTAMDLTDAQRKQWGESHKTIGDQLGTLLDPNIVPDDQLHGAAVSKVNDLVQGKFIDPGQAQQYQQMIQQTTDPTQLRAGIGMIAKNMQGAATVAAQLKTKAETEKDTAQGREANAKAAMDELKAKGLQGLTPQAISDSVDKVFDPNGTQTGGQNRLVKAQALGALQRGDLQGAQKVLEDGFQSALGIQKDIAVATNPQIQAGKIAVASAEATARQKAMSPDAEIEVAAQALTDPHNLTALKDVASMRGDQRLKIFTRAREIDPHFDPGLVNERVKFMQNYEDPKGRAAVNRQAINNILQHAGDLSDLNQEYRRTNVRVINTPLNAIANQFGNTDFTRFQTTNSVLKDELSLYFAGGYAPTTDQQKMWEKIQSDTATSAQTEAFAKEVVHLGMRRATTFNSQFKKIMGYDDPNMIIPEAKDAANKLGMGDEVKKFGSGGGYYQGQSPQPEQAPATTGGFSWDKMPEHKTPQ